MTDDVDAAIALEATLADDRRLASAHDGYASSRAAALDLDEAERIRYLYVERELLLRYERRDDPDPAMLPLLRATAHDEAIRQVAAVRAMNGNAKARVVWEDVKKED